LFLSPNPGSFESTIRVRQDVDTQTLRDTQSAERVAAD
jgi:hypothetical protein